MLILQCALLLPTHHHSLLMTYLSNAPPLLSAIPRLFPSLSPSPHPVEDDNPMVDLPIEKVFAFSRIKRPIEAFHFIFFFLWTPFGLVLMTFRLVIMLSFLITFYAMGNTPFWQPIRKKAPHIFVNFVMPCCGIFHSVRGTEYKDAVHVDKCIFVR